MIDCASDSDDPIGSDHRADDQHDPGPSGPAVLFATAEWDPVVKVGGLGEASSGLVRSLRSNGADVVVVMPDYGLVDLEVEDSAWLDSLPSWCPPVEARSGWLDGTPLTLLRFDGAARPHPYVDPATGEGWPDSVWFFLCFSAGVAALAELERPDVVHLNDWHTAPALAALPASLGTVLTIHNLAYQGVDGAHRLEQLGELARAVEPSDRRDLSAFTHHGDFNALAGGVSLADRVVVVSESYRREVLSSDGGFGLDGRLVERGDRLNGIRNGIDLGLWHPADDPWLPVNFDHEDLSGKEICRKELLELVGLEPDRGPVIGIVARLVHQKGIDLALDLVPFLESLSARLILMGSGSPVLAKAAQELAARYPDHFAALCHYDEPTAHLIVAGSDLFLMPSRFEPCGLTQMQAMTCGTIPVVTAVGGLRDTVIDTDTNPRLGTGFVADRPASLDLLHALHHACRGWANPRRRAAVQRRGMTADWSWAKLAARYLDLYNGLNSE